MALSDLKETRRSGEFIFDVLILDLLIS